MEPAQVDAAGVVKEVPASGIEARRWTVVFHRQAEHLFFSLIAMGHFKHVSAIAWMPELAVVGVRRRLPAHAAQGAGRRPATRRR
jgi:hypothetical protein